MRAELIEGAAVRRHIDDDAKRDDLSRALDRIEVSVRASAAKAVARLGPLAKRIDEHAEASVRVAFKAGLGLDILDHAPQKRKLVAGFVKGNVALIKDIAAERRKRIEKLVGEAWAAGTPWKTVAKRLEQDLGFDRNRARLIATDQVNKLQGLMIRDRQTAAGVEKFRWRTTLDGRERPSHHAAHMHVYTWADGHPTEGFPGQPVRCRCYAEPILDDDVFARAVDIIGAEHGEGEVDPDLAAFEAMITGEGPIDLDKAIASAAPKATPAAVLPLRPRVAKPRPTPEPEPAPAVVPEPELEPEDDFLASLFGPDDEPSIPTPPAPRPSRNLARDTRVPRDLDDAARMARERLEQAERAGLDEPIVEFARFEADLLERVKTEGSVRGWGSEVDASEFFAEYATAKRLASDLPTGAVRPSGAVHRATSRDRDAYRPVMQWARSLTEDEVDAIKTWSGDAYTAMRGINSMELNRQVEDSKHRFAQYMRQVETIRTAMARAPRYAGPVQRGLNMSHDPDSEFARALRTPGAVVEQPSIASWSHNEYQARKFSRTGNHAYVLYTTTDRGMSMDNDVLSLYPEEGEVMLDRGRWRVVSSTYDDTARHWRVLVEPEPD